MDHNLFSELFLRSLLALILGFVSGLLWTHFHKALGRNDYIYHNLEGLSSKLNINFGKITNDQSGWATCLGSKILNRSCQMKE